MKDDDENNNIIPFLPKSEDGDGDNCKPDDLWLKELFDTLPTVTVTFDDLESFMLEGDFSEANLLSSPVKPMDFGDNSLDTMFSELKALLWHYPEQTEFVTAQLKKIIEMMKKS